MPDSAVDAVRVEEVELPGIGMRYDLMTRKGRRVGVVQERSGRRDLLVFSREDPDACSVDRLTAFQVSPIHRSPTAPWLRPRHAPGPAPPASP